MEGAQFKTRSSGVIGIVVAIGAVLLLITAGTAAGMTLSSIRNGTAEAPVSMKAGSGSNCYMPDQYWVSPSTAEIPSAQSVATKLGGRSITPSTDKIEQVLKAARDAGVNPAVSIATWGKEQNFGNPSYAFGYGGSSTFEQQLSGNIKTLVDARDNKGNYGNRPSGTLIQTWWIDKYTPASDARNDVPQDRGIFFTFLKLLVPNQITCSDLSSSSKNMDFRFVGSELGKDDEVGIWQNIVTVMNAVGKPGENNVGVTFMGTSIKGGVNKAIVAPLKKVESDLKAARISYKFSDLQGQNVRENVNRPGTVSPHAFGTAIDINPGSNPNINPRKAGCAPRDTSCCPKDIPKEVSDIFEKNGFFWGAKFYGWCDAMHFQYGGNYDTSRVKWPTFEILPEQS